MKILSAKGSKTQQWRKDGSLESVIEGFVEVGYQTPLVLKDVGLAGLEKLCNAPPGYFGVPNGFVRESSMWTINSECTRLEFKFVDVEQKRPTVEDDPKPIIVE